MPTRHLSDEQRQRHSRFPAAPSPDQLSRYFHLDGGDREIIDGLRGDHNRLGFALMLGSARFLGAFPASSQDVPPPVTAFLADQLGMPPGVRPLWWTGLKHAPRPRSVSTSVITGPVASPSPGGAS